MGRIRRQFGRNRRRRPRPRHSARHGGTPVREVLPSRQETAQSGVGLGLAICRAIVEIHGGTINARNRPDGGALFAFRLPRDQPPPEVEPEE
nr:ATP-binding protein [Methylomonas koyamae]